MKRIESAGIEIGPAIFTICSEAGQLKGSETMSKAQHTPLQHIQKCDVMCKCQNSHTNVADTETQQHTCQQLQPENTKDKSGINVLNVEQEMSKNNGNYSNSKLYPLTVEDVPVVANLILSFLQSITFMEMVESIEMQDFEDISFTNCLKAKDFRKMIIDYFVSIAIALAGNMGNVPTKHNARLIAAAPELLEALERIIDDVDPSSRVASIARSAILKALTK